MVAVATEGPVVQSKICLRRAEQEVLFRGEAVGGTVREGVVGWGVRGCSLQRLKLQKFGRRNPEIIDSRLSRQPTDRFG